MQLSEDRRNHWAHLVLDRLYKDDLADFPDEVAALREAKQVLGAYAKAGEEADAAARRKIATLARRVPEGGREWDILYRKHFEEEMTRRKL
jgi:hypothetical protein